MVKIEFYVGREYKFDKTLLTYEEQVEAGQAVSKLLTNSYGGFIVSLAEGKYGDFPVEETLVYTVFTDASKSDSAKIQAKIIAGHYQQESVLYFTTAGTRNSGLT